jgi:NADPH-dependent curcumin reductase CurA
VFKLLNLNARVPLCGLISEYNDDPQPGPNLRRVLMNRVLIQGFIILDYFPRFPEAIAQLGQWVAEGTVKDKHTIVEGLERAPEAVNMLFDGDNLGKLIVKL